MSKEAQQASTEVFKFATVDQDYASGLPRVRMDGEEDLGVVGHHYVGDPPLAQERVMMVRHGKQWVIVGKVT